MMVVSKVNDINIKLSEILNLVDLTDEGIDEIVKKKTGVSIHDMLLGETLKRVTNTIGEVMNERD